MVNPNMEMYLLAGMSDVPKIDIVLNNMPERGVIGIGEPPTVSTASAIANAVAQRDRRDDSQPAAASAQGARGARAGDEQEGRCEGFRLRQSGERERRGRRAEGRAASTRCRSPAGRICSRG